MYIYACKIKYTHTFTSYQNNKGRLPQNPTNSTLSKLHWLDGRMVKLKKKINSNVTGKYSKSCFYQNGHRLGLSYLKKLFYFIIFWIWESHTSKDMGGLALEVNIFWQSGLHALTFTGEKRAKMREQNNWMCRRI